MLYKLNNTKSKLNIFLEYFTIILIILQCNSLFFSPIFKILLQICIFTLFIIGFFNIKTNHNNSYKLFIFLIIFSSFVILFLIFSYYKYSYPIRYIFLLLLNPIMLIFYFYSFIQNNQIDVSFLIRLEDIIVLFSIVSLFFWILAILGMHPNSYIISNWTGRPEIIPGYFHVFYLSQGKINFMGLQILRNTGIFTEAPMYSFVLSIAVLIELFIKNNSIINFRIIILIIVTLTTASTTGIIIIILAISYSIFIRNEHNNSFFIILFIIILPIIIILLKFLLLNKIGNGTDLNSSFNVRIDDIIASFKTWKEHFIIGNGLNNNYSIIQNVGYWRSISNENIGFSTGFMTSLAYGGIYLGSFYIIPTLLAGNVSRKLRGLTVFSFILFIFTIISTTYLYTLLLSYFWAVIIYNKGFNNSN